MKTYVIAIATVRVLVVAVMREQAVRYACDYVAKHYPHIERVQLRDIQVLEFGSIEAVVFAPGVAASPIEGAQMMKLD